MEPYYLLLQVISPACFLLWHFNNSVPRGRFPGCLQWDVLIRTRQWVGSLLWSLAGPHSLNELLRHPKGRPTRRGDRSRTITLFQWWHLLGMQTRTFQPRHFAFYVAQNSGFLSAHTVKLERFATQILKSRSKEQAKKKREWQINIIVRVSTSCCLSIQVLFLVLSIRINMKFSPQVNLMGLLHLVSYQYLRCNLKIRILKMSNSKIKAQIKKNIMNKNGVRFGVFI